MRRLELTRIAPLYLTIAGKKSDRFLFFRRETTVDPTALSLLVDSTKMLAAMATAYMKWRGELGVSQRLDVIEAGKIRPESVQPVIAKVIDKGLLDRSIERVEDATDRFADAVADIRCTPAQLDQEEKIAQATVCRYLQLIRDHNEDELPDDQLEQAWKSFRCADVVKNS